MWDHYLRVCIDLASQSHEQRYNLIHFMPVLLTRNVQEKLGKAAGNLIPADADKVSAVLKELSELTKKYETDAAEYPIGLGPIELIFLQIQSGELSQKQAEEKAAKESVASMLGPLYVHKLSAFNLKTASEGQWRESAVMQKLLLRSLHTFEQFGDMGDALPSTVFDWIEIVHMYVYELPDPRIFHSAVEEGEELISRARAAGNTELIGETSHRLGTLYLDPYAARSNLKYKQQIEQWRRRFYEAIGPSISSLPQEDREMPEPMEALKRAEEYLTQAAELRTKERQGFSLKALAQAIKWQMIVGHIERKADLVRVCTEALQALSAENSPQEWVSILNMRGAGADQSETETVERILTVSWDSYVRKIGMRYTLDLITQSVYFLEESGAVRRSFRLLVESRRLFELAGGESLQVSRWSNLLSLMFRTAEVPKDLLHGGIADCREKILARARQEGWDSWRVAASLLCLAERSQNTNEEALGLDLLAEASRQAPLFAGDVEDLIEYLRIILFMGVGVNGVNSEDWGQAVHGYATSLQLALRFDLKDIHTELLRRVDDISNRGGEAALTLAAELVPLGLKIVRSLGEAGGRWLRQLAKRTIAGMAQSNNPGVFAVVCQLGKGARFAAALAAGTCYQWRGDTKAEHILELIQKTERWLKSSQDSPPDEQESGLDDSVILCSYDDADTTSSGDTPWQRLYNLQRSFDGHINRQLLSYAQDETKWYLFLRDIQASLDSRTVLLNLYLGVTMHGTTGLYASAITNDDIRTGVVDRGFPDSYVQIERTGVKLSVHPIALTVSQLREELAYSPGPGRAVTPEGERLLSEGVKGYLGHLHEYLRKLRLAGKDHICIVPHGPLHFYPFHLLGEAGEPWAADTIVTYLPNLALLLSPRGHPSVFRHRSRALSALGLTFKQVRAFELEELPQSEQETTRIANLFGVSPIVEKEATEEAVKDALLNSRYVHLSTHGAHNVLAPAFQCLFLAPTDDTDGRLHAYEVLKMDLRGLEMLTLSACETALGRFDEGDNLSGLPSSFLQTGVSTIIGTLWPVDPDAAEHFFTHLYANVKENRDRRDAFFQAQQDTRKTFPMYKDWGAFYYIGGWR